MVDRVGQQLGSYRLLRLLGRGGFAEVYLGEHVRLSSYVAVKVLNTQLAGSDAEGFQLEAHTIARLLHPHIIRIFDYDVADGIPFLVMDYAPNGTLRNYHPKGTRVLLSSIVSYVQQVADALQYAHSQKVIHRDIKPENMLVGRNNEVLLSDFGIATLSQSSRYQDTGDIVGTVAYMAPEQIQGKHYPASDQYSLGIVVYEWLSGERPFHGSFSEIAVQQAVAPPPPLRMKVPDIPPEIEQVILIALAKNPHQRFANVTDFAIALQQASMSAPSLPTVPTRNPLSPANVDSTPPNTSTSSQPERKLPRRIVLAGLAGAGLVAAGAGIAWLIHAQSSSIVAKSSQPGKISGTQVPRTPIAGNESPSSGSWSRLTSLPSPEAFNVAIYVRLQQRDYIYMTGGYRGQNRTPKHDNNLYRYDIAAAQWEIVTNNFPGMFNNAVVQDNQNRLFFTGGYSPDNNIVTTLLYMYQPDTEALQEVVPPGNISFGYAGSMLSDQNGHLYLTQGFMKVVNTYTKSGTGWYRYDIAGNQWYSLAPLPLGVGYAVLAPDGQGGIVLLGGVTDTEQQYGTTGIYRYNIALDNWKHEPTASPQAFNGSASCPVGKGQVVVVGGYDPVQNTVLNNTWLIDLSTLNPRALAPLPGGGSRLGAAACDQAGNVYLVRGDTNDPNGPSADFLKLSLNI